MSSGPPTCAHALWQTTIKFCMVIKFLHGRPRMPMRDLFAVADLLVLSLQKFAVYTLTFFNNFQRKLVIKSGNGSVQLSQFDPCGTDENKMKKCSEETQTLRAGCGKAEPKNRPATDPFPGAQDGQNLINWRWSLPLPTNPVWWGTMLPISSYRGNRPTHTPPPNKQTNKQTNRTDYNTLLRSFASVQCNYQWQKIASINRTSEISSDQRRRERRWRGREVAVFSIRRLFRRPARAWRGTALCPTVYIKHAGGTPTHPHTHTHTHTYTHTLVSRFIDPCAPMMEYGNSMCLLRLCVCQHSKWKTIDFEAPRNYDFGSKRPHGWFVDLRKRMKNQN